MDKNEATAVPSGNAAENKQAVTAALGGVVQEAAAAPATGSHIKRRLTARMSGGGTGFKRKQKMRRNRIKKAIKIGLVKASPKKQVKTTGEAGSSKDAAMGESSAAKKSAPEKQ